MWPIKEKENRQLLILWPNLIPLYQAVGMRCYGSLININPSGRNQPTSTIKILGGTDAQ